MRIQNFKYILDSEIIISQAKRHPRLFQAFKETFKVVNTILIFPPARYQMCYSLRPCC